MEFKQGNKLHAPLLALNRLCPAKRSQHCHVKTHVMRGSGRDLSALAALKSHPYLSLPGTSQLWYRIRKTIIPEGTALPQGSRPHETQRGNPPPRIPCTGLGAAPNALEPQLWEC